ncbi:DUF791-domain-containing protein [Neolentinus lepideus HHB14362 ss-1]|uniref:Molybdate-anion transporter n=1 Tax=Neolentinus lepideus HHB14362 ss-1 TaxID=1314782 RepID=A0A165S9M1_9AGAM|nr:DUF791-domain-containing protein [Neolentinus lepideus HHB14362 ss-1]
MVLYYELQLTILTVFCVISLLLERYVSNKRTQAESGHGATSAAVAALTKQYIIVYAIVMGADWLQGPYVYSLYREQYDFPERIVAVLFVTGFMSAGLAAPLIGAWADKHGRKRMCMAFCISYTLTCVCILIPYLPILLLGRAMGGVSTSILFSAFESWLISDASSKGIPQADLSSIMGRATLVNGFVATAAGVASNQLVSSTESFASPFVASGELLILAWMVIRNLWVENFGAGGGGTAPESDLFQVKRLGQAWRIVRQDPVLLVLGLTQTCFEGSMYLFVFLWVPSLQESKPLLSPPLPLGYIFSCFMISMMLGSLLYTAITSYSLPSSESSLVLHAKLSSLVCAVSALALGISVKSHDEHVRFWTFCAFEACVGMYYPVQGMLRGTLISNEHRATLSSLFRVPLNVFVVVSLLTGVSSARQAVLTASSAMLAFSSVMTGCVVLRRVEQQHQYEPPLSAEDRLA